jgi:hypothetical protein
MCINIYTYTHTYIEDLFVYYIYTYTYVLWKHIAYIDSMCIHVYIYTHELSGEITPWALRQTYPASKPVMEIEGGKNVAALVKS